MRQIPNQYLEKLNIIEDFTANQVTVHKEKAFYKNNFAYKRSSNLHFYFYGIVYPTKFLGHVFFFWFSKI